MTFKEFKIILDGIRSGGGITDDTKLIPLTNEAMKMVARTSKPLTLVSSDIADEILTHIDESDSLYEIVDSEDFIRVPEKIVDDNSVLDIDDDLTFAVVYQTAMLFASNKAEYKILRDGYIADYAWMKYNVVQGMKDE